MGSFDSLSRNWFKTAPDGRQVFFPWGIFGRGYTFGSAEDYRRLRRQVNAFILVEYVAIIIAGVVRFSVASPALAYYWPIAFFGLLLFFVVLHFLWMRSLLGRLQSSDERLSLRDLVAPRMTIESNTTRVPEPPAERVLRLVVVSGMVLALIVAAIQIATKALPFGRGFDPYPAPVHIVTVVNLQAIVKSSVTQSTFTVLFWAPPLVEMPVAQDVSLSQRLPAACLAHTRRTQCRSLWLARSS